MRPRPRIPRPAAPMTARPCSAGVALAAAVLCAAAAGGGPDVAADPEAAFFETHIRPALVEHCLECHGADADPPGGNLRLDLRAGWELGGDSGPALAPGEATPGVLMAALRYESSEMPPDGKLPDEVIGRFAQWIAAGAHDPRGGTLDAPERREYAAGDPDGWAFTPPRLEPVPAVQNDAWPRTAADRFVLAKVEAAGLTPAADAAPAAAFRRLHYDLAGLPPEPDDLAAFVADPSEENWAAAVDRLLASPRFGRVWGRHWLDVARYADSNGSDFNATWPDAWRYRDYVVDSFNAGVPFDRFVVEQIAGDFLPAATDAGRARNTVATGFLALGTKMLSERDKEKLALDVADEQIDTVGRSLMGLTLGCARCHDHKFDPVPARDYYALAGIFASTKVFEGEIIEYVSDFPRVPLPDDPAAKAARERHAAAVKALAADLAAATRERDEVELGLGGDAVPVDSAGADLVGGWSVNTYTKPYVGDGYLSDGDAGKGEKTATFAATLPAGGTWEARLFYSPGGNRATDVPVSLHAGGDRTAAVVDMRRPGGVAGRAVVLGRFEAAAGDAVAVVVSNAGTDGYVLADAVAFVPAGAGGAVDSSALAAADAEVARLTEELKSLKNAAPPGAPVAFAVTDLPAENVADAALRIRGESSKHGDVIPRGFLSVCGNHEPAELTGSGRLELARWVVSPDHPLTARVFVNRVWGHLFGRGIVRSADNFGSLGTPPTHPELLDHLAVRFADSGWGVKRLVRELVTTRTYRLASAHPAAAAADPDNDLFARANRRRLTAEALRDATLRLAGTLDETRPAGSPVAGFDRLAVDTASGKPTGPADLSASTAPSLFLPVIRNELPAGLAAFDFADPEAVVGVRPSTSGPAQSLFLLNAPQIRARAAAAGARFGGSPGTRAGRVAALYTAALSRPPAAAELRRVTAFLDESAARDPGGERAAWADLAHVLICSAEFRFLD